MARPKKSKEKFLQRNVGMTEGQWTIVEKAAKEKGWTVSRYVRAISVNFALGNLVNKKRFVNKMNPAREDILKAFEVLDKELQQLDEVKT